MLFRSLLLTVAVSAFFATPLMAQQQPGHALPTLAAEEHPFLEWGGEYPRWSRLTPAKGVADIRLAIDRARQKLETICQVPPQGATCRSDVLSRSNAARLGFRFPPFAWSRDGASSPTRD